MLGPYYYSRREKIRVILLMVHGLFNHLFHTEKAITHTVLSAWLTDNAHYFGVSYITYYFKTAEELYKNSCTMFKVPTNGMERPMLYGVIWRDRSTATFHLRRKLLTPSCLQILSKTRSAFSTLVHMAIHSTAYC